MDNEKVKKVLSSLQRQCSRRECCSTDVYKKALKSLDGDVEATSMVLENLKADKYVDDLRYASAYIREKAAISGWGMTKISYMLAAKGIDRAVISEAARDVDPAASSRKLESVIRAKYRTLAEDPSVKLKLLRFALGRGYSYDEVREVVEKVISGE